ncbi:MAG: hypothetical protein COU90_02600 [Candidatus Ryanbacteria bacterium CG10_big_fil_rev_8_21_14_0_10_43_42]|uniref:Thioredoxin domain-containing protein n=1 Tax=Candidatus Ryanbacteria bacterium CG10_big_fil_rev_8_21_14_0_10_43_42 TaxID=1974864 RepID=A0A2M8KWM9_9BACT|nr:MAG: hypothetical protein COU90_02600 [Candidatus Ryanbacteria bacterium CG10_big_fil_rev_8_21_14_0_10_43_42]
MLLEFYGEECPHCQEMDALVKKLEEETGVRVETFETWHNTENARKMEEYDRGLCGGVPFFFNTESGNFICGETSYENLKHWAEEKSALSSKKE